MENAVPISQTLTIKVFKVLVIDDDTVDRLAVVRAFKSIDLAVELIEATDCATAISLLNQHQFDCIFVDYRLPDGNGLELIETIRHQGIVAPIVSLTGQSDDQVAVALMKAGASDYLSKTNVSAARLRQVFQNVMRVYYAEQAAAFANHQREELLGQKEEFISRMTHDLQTPLVAANRMLSLIQDDSFGAIPDQVKKTIDTIVRSNQDLLQMVRNIVEAYSYDADAKQFNFIPIDLRKIVGEVIEELRPLAVAKNLELNITLVDQHHTSSSFQMNGDRLELKRLITNLLGNSLKFTDSGSISAQLTPATVDRPWITIAIADTGTGISPVEQINLFERFRRGKHKRSNSGLGLYLCKQIVQIHSGKILVQSIPGQGSTFTVILPSSLTTTHPQLD